ncbi:MAG: Si-specific NAD(P)(+) transhydrogenase [Gammaproteobacteria bacterium]|nr:Si-specific NAD(P)(+) transhydrogenase [Gammaproteobacteria bacterium]
MEHYDFVAIGSGPAGQRAAIQAAKLGARVALIERRHRIGGVALHTGTIPSKTLREAILYLTGWRQRSFYGRSYRIKDEITADDLHQRLDITINHEMEILYDQFARNNVELIYGTASFDDPHCILTEADDGEIHRVTADKILIATGTRPRRPDDIPFDDMRILDADSVLKARTIPRSLTIIGAGVIGVEYAAMFNALGVDVTLVNEHETMLPFIDREIMEEFIHYQRENNMRLEMGEKITAVKHNGDSVTTELVSGRQITTEALIFAAGRIGCTSALRLENAGLQADDRHNLKVDKHYRTVVEHIYAAGDLIGFPSLASTSMEQGRQAALHALGHGGENSLQHIPYGIYAVPEISMIGMTEQQLREQNIAFEAGVARLRETARGQILGLHEGILKLLVAVDDQRILGVHVVGEGATELVHIGQAVMMMGGKLDYFVNTVFNYPTLAEAYKVAALDAWNRLSKKG